MMAVAGNKNVISADHENLGQGPRFKEKTLYLDYYTTDSNQTIHLKSLKLSHF